MLSALRVTNLVVVRDIDVEFGPGLTVLTGETGAGKSVLVDALGLALGARADSKLVRAGEDRAEVSASFDLSGLNGMHDVLAAQEIEHDGECVLRRTLTREGRSRAWCNGTPVALNLLRDIAARLVDIHAQHAGHRLLGGDEQRRLLDAYGGLGEELTAVHDAWQAWRATRDALAAMDRDGADGARAELLEYQVSELTDAALTREELDSIEAHHRQLANASSHLEAIATIRDSLLADGSGARDLVARAAAGARDLGRALEQAANLDRALEQADAALGEAASELTRLEDAVRSDPAELELVDRRLAELHALARKHQVELGDLAAVAEALADELRGLRERRADGETLRAQLDDQRRVFDERAGELSTARHAAARRMGAEISERLLGLGMPHGRFIIEVDDTGGGEPQDYGRDQVRFLVSTNPESEPDLVSRVASGGELSRIALAIQAATAQLSGVPVVVYDEVDTGIGGNTANIVGRSLHEVAACSQVICITHSPQVASAGDHHLLVSKALVDGEAESHLAVLDRAGREKEISRMLGATRDQKTGVAHARKLLDAAARG